jgi:hypothetical protein
MGPHLKVGAKGLMFISTFFTHCVHRPVLQTDTTYSYFIKILYSIHATRCNTHLHKQKVMGVVHSGSLTFIMNDLNAWDGGNNMVAHQLVLLKWGRDQVPSVSTGSLYNQRALKSFAKNMPCAVLLVLWNCKHVDTDLEFEVMHF